MIILAILIQQIGHFLPSWITKIKIKELRAQLKWRQFFFELSGFSTVFLLAFLIITIQTISTKSTYLLNKDAIYGVNCSPLAKEIGFKDGDKILTINGKSIHKFSEITIAILQAENAKVKLLRNHHELFIETNDIFIKKLLQQIHIKLFTPRLKPIDSTLAKTKPLQITKSTNGLKEVFLNFKLYIKQAYSIVNLTKNQITDIRGRAIIKITDFKSFIASLAVRLIAIGLITLIPLPGFELGNAIIAIIEKIRNKNFNPRIMKILRITCITLTILLIIIM